jgi:hypothetical protein
MFIKSVGVKYQRFKMVRLPTSSDSWFKSDGIHLKDDHGAKLLTQVIEAVRRSLDKGGVMSTSSSLERDMR